MGKAFALEHGRFEVHLAPAPVWVGVHSEWIWLVSALVQRNWPRLAFLSFTVAHLELDLEWYTGNHRLSFAFLGFWLTVTLAVSTRKSKETLEPIVKAMKEIQAGSASIKPFDMKFPQRYKDEWTFDWWSDWDAVVTPWRSWNWTDFRVIDLCVSAQEARAGLMGLGVVVERFPANAKAGEER